MVGITDAPFRALCRRFGAAMTPSEMVSVNALLYGAAKTRQRLVAFSDPEPRVTQIVGTDPELMALAARQNVDLGAQVVDINMGCPAKKVCNKSGRFGIAQG